MIAGGKTLDMSLTSLCEREATPKRELDFGKSSYPVDLDAFGE